MGKMDFIDGTHFFVLVFLFLLLVKQLIASIEIYEPIAIIRLPISALMIFYFVTVHRKARKKVSGKEVKILVLTYETRVQTYETEK